MSRLRADGREEVREKRETARSLIETNGGAEGDEEASNKSPNHRVLTMLQLGLGIKRERPSCRAIPLAKRN